MPRFKVTEQQSIASAPQAGPDVFGAPMGAGVSNLGRAVSQVGGQLADIEIRNQERSDVIDRVRQQNSFDEAAISLRQSTLDGMDISNPATLDTFRNGLKTEMDRIISEHTGSSHSKASLRASLTNAQGQYMKQMMGDQIQAQQSMLADSVSSLSNELSSATAASPGILDDAMLDLDARIDDLSPALTDEQEAGYRRLGKENILRGAISTYLERGDYQSAKSLMNDSNYAKIISPEVSRRFRIETAKVEGDQMAMQQAYNERVAQYTLLSGREMTPEELARIKLLPDKPSEMTPADKIAEFEVVMGRDATQSEVDKFFGVANTGKFGGGLRGRMFDLVNSGVAAYSAGTMNATEANEFQSAVSELYGIKEHKNIVTGVRSQSQPSMPPFVREALRAGTDFYGNVEVGGLAEAGIGSVTEPDDFEGESLWDISAEVSGPITGAQRIVFETMGLGEPHQQKAAFVANHLREKIVAGIRPGGKIANQYRQELMQLVDIQPKLIQSDTAYRHKLVDIDTELRRSLKELVNISSGETAATVQERRDALTLSNNIMKALGRMGVQRPKSLKERNALPIGSYYVAPNGEVLQRTANEGE